jgi:streptogramin lyase
MRFAFVVFDATNHPANELVGVFSTEAEANENCLNKSYYIFPVRVNQATHESVPSEEGEFGYCFPRHGYATENYQIPTEETP